MKMTQEADNAVRIVYTLASAGGRLGAADIAERTGVSHRFALKILGKLVASGVVRSYKGKCGGYELAKKPSETTLREVIETVDGPYMISRCVDASHHCEVDDCKFKTTFAEISRAISERLDEVTFERFL